MKMKVGDLVKVVWNPDGGGLDCVALIIDCQFAGFYTILCGGEERTMHSDFMEVLNADR